MLQKSHLLIIIIIIRYLLGDFGERKYFVYYKEWPSTIFFYKYPLNMLLIYLQITIIINMT